MELIDRNKIEFSPIEIYNFDEYKHEVTGMALFKDIKKIPTVKAIPLDKVKKARKEIENLIPWDALRNYFGWNDERYKSLRSEIKPLTR